MLWRYLPSVSLFGQGVYYGWTCRCGLRYLVHWQILFSALPMSTGLTGKTEAPKLWFLSVVMPSATSDEWMAPANGYVSYGAKTRKLKRQYRSRFYRLREFGLLHAFSQEPVSARGLPSIPLQPADLNPTTRKGSIKLSKERLNLN